MANKKTPGRDAFEAARKAIDPFIPSTYAKDVLELLPGVERQHIYHVRAGKTVDWVVLEALQTLARKSQQLQPA